MAARDESSGIKTLEAEIERLRSELAESEQKVQALVAAHEHAKGVLEVAVDGILTIDEVGRIEFANPAVCEIFGFEADELVGQNVGILMPPPIDREHESHVGAFRQGARPKILGRAQKILARRRDGTSFPIEIVVSEVMAGSRLLFTGTIRDVSERRAAELRLEQEHQRLREVFDSAVDGIIVSDESGTIREANRAVETLFGYSPNELLGEDVTILMPPPFREEHAMYMKRYLETGERRIIGMRREVRGKRKDGSTFPLYLAVSTGFEDDRQVFTAFLHDLGQLRDAEERARRAEQLAEVSTISAGIAHDVGTPMTTILGYAELLQRSVGDPKNRERAGHIVEQVRRVKDLLRTLLDIARPRSATPAELSLGDVLDHSLGFFRERLKGRGIVIERNYSRVPSLVGHRDRLEQVFLNLIVNAIDAMPGGGTLTVHLRKSTPDLIEVSIADTGIGIEPETLQHIFEPFYTTKERGEGTGLGLLVSRRIIHDHGGRIDAESEPGVGTKMSILLPISDPDRPSPSASRSKSRTSRKPASKRASGSVGASSRRSTPKAKPKSKSSGSAEG